MLRFISAWMLLLHATALTFAAAAASQTSGGSVGRAETN